MLNKKILLLSICICGVIQVLFIKGIPINTIKIPDYIFLYLSDETGREILIKDKQDKIKGTQPPEVVYFEDYDKIDLISDNMVLNHNIEFKQDSIMLPEDELVPRFTNIFESIEYRVLKETDYTDKYKIAYAISGPASERSIVYAEFPEDIDIFIPSMTLYLSIWIDYRGEVVFALIEKSSGSIMFDNMMIKHVKKWKFNPIYVSGEQNFQNANLQMFIEKI